MDMISRSTRGREQAWIDGIGTELVPGLANFGRIPPRRERRPPAVGCGWMAQMKIQLQELPVASPSAAGKKTTAPLVIDGR